MFGVSPRYGGLTNGEVIAIVFNKARKASFKGGDAMTKARRREAKGGR
jgi:hypothetical protein